MNRHDTTHIKPVKEFWEWVNKLPMTAEHPFQKKRRGNLEFLIFERRTHTRFPTGVYIFQSTPVVPIVAISRLEVPPEHAQQPDTLWGTYTEVDPAYRGQGRGAALIRSCFEYAAERGLTYQATPHTERGQAHLLPHYPRLVRETGVKLTFSDEEDRKLYESLCEAASAPQPSYPQSHIRTIAAPKVP